jgi:hypothetical protein
MGSGDLVGPCSCPRPGPVGLRPGSVSLRPEPVCLRPEPVEGRLPSDMRPEPFDMCPELVGMCPELVEGRIPPGATSSGRKTPRNSRNVMTRALPFCRSVALSEQGADKSARLNSDPRDPQLTRQSNHCGR